MNQKFHARLEARREKLSDRSVDQGNAWFSKGELAFGLGQPRALPDGRASLKNRVQFYEGWDAAARRQLISQRTPEELAESRARFDRLKEFAKSL